MRLFARVGSLKLQVPPTRDGSFKTEIFKRLKNRGLNELAFVVTDNHAARVNALNQPFQGVMRNILRHSPRHLKQVIANEIKLIFKVENKLAAIN